MMDKKQRRSGRILLQSIRQNAPVMRFVGLLFLSAALWLTAMEKPSALAGGEQGRQSVSGGPAEETSPNGNGGSVSGNETGDGEETPSVSANKVPGVRVEIWQFDETAGEYVRADRPYIGRQPYRVVLCDVEPGDTTLQTVRLRCRVETDGQAPEEKEWCFDLLSGEDIGENISFALEAVDGSHIRYQALTLELLDQEGAVYDLSSELPVRSLEIDRKAPQVQVMWNGTGKTDYIYHGGGAGFFFTVEAWDETEMTAAIYCADSVELAQTASEKKEDVAVTGGRVSFGSWVYDREKTVGYPDQKQRYVVSVTDRAGNVTWTEATEILIDETKAELVRENGGPAIYYQFENMLHMEKGAEEDARGVQGNALDACLPGDRLLSRCDVVITVDVQDPGMTADGPDENGMASGVEKAVLKTDRQTFLPEGEPASDGQKRRYTFRIPAETGAEQVYRLERLELTDRAGNVTDCLLTSRPAGKNGQTEGPALVALTVVTDARQPEVTFRSETYAALPQDRWPEWYSAAANGNHPFFLTADAEDRYGVYSVEWYMLDRDDGESGGDQTTRSGTWTALTAAEPGKADRVPDLTTGDPAQTVFASTLSFLAAQNRLYGVRVTDWAGNRTELICRDDAAENRGSRVRIDNQAPVIKETEQMLQVSYRFRNVKHDAADGMVRDQALEEKGCLIDGRLVSGTNVRIVVEAADRPEDGTETASGIREVALVTDRGEQVMPAADASGGTYGFWLTGAAEQETVYECRGIRITDYAGNSRVYLYDETGLGRLTVVVDKKGPCPPERGVFSAAAGTGTVQKDGEEGLSDWYSAADGGAKTICASVRDDYGVSAISWYAVKPGMEGQSCRQQVRTLVNPSEKAGMFTHSISFSRDQDQLYGVAAVDWAGNETVFQEDHTGPDGSRVKIDNRAPEAFAMVRWESDYDSSANMKADWYEMPYAGSVYGRDRMILEVCVRDDTVDGLHQGEVTRISSDIRKVDVTIHHDGREETLTAEHTPGMETAMIDQKPYLSFSFPICLENETRSETEKTIDHIVIWDYAGNATTVEGASAQGGVTYILDHKAPVLDVDYHEGSYVRDERYPDTYFYCGDPAVTVSVTERYFHPEDRPQMMVDRSASGASDSLTQNDWKTAGQTHSSIFSADRDGRYRFRIGYEDRSGNRMEGEGTVDGTYTSPYLVRDTTAPVLHVTYTCEGADITTEIGGGNVYPDVVTATVRITETNFNPALTRLQAVGQQAADNEDFVLNWDGDWRQEEENVYVNTVTFARQGTYTFQCGVKDIVGLEAEPPQKAYFSVDMTGPEARILWESDTPENGMYYDGARTALIQVRDRFFLPETVEMALAESAPQPAVEAWRHIPAPGCTGTAHGHVDDCVHEARLTFAADGDYTLSFRCGDRAGHLSPVVTVDPFVIDRTAPELTVTYDNNDAHGGIYYNNERTAVITVTEHNFHEEDVVIGIAAEAGKDGAAIPVPSVGQWSSIGDIHRASVSFVSDGTFTLEAGCRDLAGNTAKPYEQDRFIIDMTPPVVEITGVGNHSANNGMVAPCITYRDDHPDPGSIVQELTGAIHGGVTVHTTITALPDGRRIQYADFPYEKETDDLYTLNVTASDLAGNEVVRTMMFSVNRFGSVYLPDHETETLLKRGYVNEPVRLRITEINVDLLEQKELTYSRDGEIFVMEPGTDYTVTMSGDERSWKAYTYDIGPDNFRKEGAYTVTLYSEDSASNQSTNRVKATDLSFVVDMTAPSVVITGVEDGKRYEGRSRRAVIDVKDNIALSGMSVYLSDRLTEQYNGEQLSAAGGVLTLELDAADDWQTLEVTAVDAAGNECVRGPVTVLITPAGAARRVHDMDVGRFPFPAGAAVAGMMAVLGGAAAVGRSRRRRRQRE